MNTADKLDQLINDKLELSSLPNIYSRISNLLNDEKSTHEQITEVIQSDPALSVRILKVVNSSFYGYPQQISTILQAIGILGRRSLRNIILSTIVAGMCRRMSNDVFDLERYWQHSVRTAVLSKLLVMYSDQKAQAESIFIAGLLHDIGQLVIAHQLPDQAKEIQMQVMDGAQHQWQVEKNILGFDHSELGAQLIQQWNLPALLVESIRYHHEPQQAKNCKTCCYVIHLANKLAYLEDDADVSLFQQSLSDTDDWPITQINAEMLGHVMADAREQFQSVMSMFK